MFVWQLLGLIPSKSNDHQQKNRFLENALSFLPNMFFDFFKIY